MTFLERRLLFLEKHDRLLNREKLKADVMFYDGLREPISATRRNLSHPMAVIEGLYDGLSEIGPRPPSATEVAVKVRLFTEYIATPGGTAPKGVTCKQLVSAIDALAKELSATNTTAWQARIQPLKDVEPRLANPDLDTLAGLFGEKQTLAALRRRVGMVRAACTVLPPTKAERDTCVSDVKAIVRDFDLLVAGLGTDLPAPTKAFLQAALTPRGAPLDLMTAEVKEWLEERGILSRVTVRIG